MKKHLIFMFVTAAVLSAGPGNSMGAQEAQPQTVAEASGYKATSRYADVVKFIHAVQDKSPLIRVETMGGAS